MTPLQVHISEWKECRKCGYCETRTKVVIGKGDITCDILFIGEAPGQSENILGIPFIGKAGKILDRIINKTFGPLASRKYRLAYTNLIACIPIESGHEKEEPDVDSILSCKPRVEEFIKLAQPRLIVAVGKLSEDWLYQGHKDSIRAPNIPIVAIQHPASILRMPPPAQPLSEHRCSVIISSAVTEYLE